MLFRVSAELTYELVDTALFLFAIKCGHTLGQRIMSESFYFHPTTSCDHFSVAGNPSRFTRITAGPGRLHVRYQADVNTRYTLTDPWMIQNSSLKSVRPEVMPFLFPSRYCQSDRFRAEAFELFGHLPTQYAIAAGINDWIYRNITYSAGATNEQSSAIDTFLERRGVCRDFAHLGIAMCRAMSLPARYVSCYSHLLQPNDFHAIFEVYIGGVWYAFDPTHMAPMNGMVRIATGKDAAETSICSMFGSPLLVGIEVICNARDPDFVPRPYFPGQGDGKAIALL